MDTYLRGTATVALHKVAMQMRARGYQVLLLTSELPEFGLPQLRLQVDLEHERNFRYQFFPVAAERPDFDEASDAPSSDLYYRLEVYDLTGSLGFDVYERHLAFLYMQQTQPGDADLSDGAEPERMWREDL